ncbi:MerR family transcriptional regulator [Lewinella sp. IMCC34183]|uniref:MerR family transcriptional regulator n=1 Tax=Lewinella sp. IMCC34183 TaxID=2248762 RepID=UPI001E3F7679|nr:MerR family transcriptional regulator [Lewinella sp. IMCC34183]
MTGEAHPGKVRITQKVVLFALTSPPTAMPNDPDEDDLKRYYSIGEVAKKLGVNTSLIRFWENEFSHIKPNKNSRGDRRFTKENIQQLREVYHLVRERGFTLDGARREIASAGKPQAGKQEVIDRLLAVRGRLKALRDA